MSTNNSKSDIQNSPHGGALSFISGVVAGDDAQPEILLSNTSRHNVQEMAKLQQDLLLLISELEEFVLDED